MLDENPEQNTDEPQTETQSAPEETTESNEPAAGEKDETPAAPVSAQSADVPTSNPDQEEYDRKQAELQEQNEEHIRRTGGGEPVRESSSDDTQRQLDETVSDYNRENS